MRDSRSQEGGLEAGIRFEGARKDPNTGAARRAVTNIRRMLESKSARSRQAFRWLVGPLTAVNVPCPKGSNQMLETHTRRATTSASSVNATGREGIDRSILQTKYHVNDEPLDSFRPMIGTCSNEPTTVI